MNGSSWLLGSGNPWHTAGADDAVPGPTPPATVANEQDGLSLPSLAAGPLGLASADDSLGRLVLPRGVAVEGDSLFILSDDGSFIYRYDPLHQSLEPLAFIGAQGLSGPQDDSAFLEPRRFRDACAIAVQHGTLYVADPAAQRVQVFDLQTLALVRIHGGIHPADLAAGADGVFILDRRSGRVYEASPRRDSLMAVVDLNAGGAARPSLAGRAHRWDRVAIDRQGRIYLRYRCADTLELDVFDVSRCLPATCMREQIFDSAEVRDRFLPPPITMDGSGVLAAPDRLLDPCGLRRAPANGLSGWEIDDRFYVADPTSGGLHVYLSGGRLRHRFGPFDQNGLAVAADSPDAWSLADVAALDSTALVLDERHQFVYGHRLGEGTLRQWFAAPAGFERRWRRIAAEASGCLLLWDGRGTVVDRLTQHGRSLGTVALRTVRALFARSPSARQPSSPPNGVMLTRSGVRARPRKAIPAWPAARFHTGGDWTSEWLDSRYTTVCGTRST